jgi:hypothetical protein
MYIHVHVHNEEINNILASWQASITHEASMALHPNFSQGVYWCWSNLQIYKMYVTWTRKSNKVSMSTEIFFSRSWDGRY